MRGAENAETTRPNPRVFHAHSTKRQNVTIISFETGKCHDYLMAIVKRNGRIAVSNRENCAYSENFSILKIRY